MTNDNEFQIDDLKFENAALKKVMAEVIDKLNLTSIHALVIKYGMTYDDYLSLLHLLGTAQGTLSVGDVTAFFNESNNRYESLTDKDTRLILHALKNADIMVEQVTAILKKNDE